MKACDVQLDITVGTHSREQKHSPGAIDLIGFKLREQSVEYLFHQIAVPQHKIDLGNSQMVQSLLEPLHIPIGEDTDVLISEHLPVAWGGLTGLI